MYGCKDQWAEVLRSASINGASLPTREHQPAAAAADKVNLGNLVRMPCVSVKRRGLHSSTLHLGS